MKNWIIEQIPPKETHEWILNKHYAHRIPSTISFCFGLYRFSILEGICAFGSPATVKFSKLDLSFKINELSRLCINDGLGKNVLSYFVGKCLNLLPKPMLLMSFSDENYGHHGYIYQATNWIYTGLGGSEKELSLNNISYHVRHMREMMENRNMKMDNTKTLEENWVLNGGKIIRQKPKYRYFYILSRSKKERKEILNILKSLYEFLPYPKGDNIRYDSSYKPQTQGVLF